MTDDEMRVAIAEWMGWKPIKEVNKQTWWVPPAPALATYTLPDYPNDLNAVHSAEEHGGLVVIKAMRFHLWEICDQMTAHHATARQRCEALLKTLGLWRDSALEKEAR